ncbi:Na+/H+ antiporter NhaA [Dactylosporangium matsuzakiense]|uniref:Na(+)/H(+) antiporter NhaA n=1 Tax=Dactylosporangium matsuzakiense TaxID=53360 RepID=A0A9W6NJU8_9ACTN|nr:Na+/H+ antiporter NhaA [Dactylosporangium matsuzakiense]UWZ44437.1 Na+/H+ antiporter NhaA [Dactylosporangium matsuzakiense]GLK99397.1 Na(+)/H(+) antiporter NhaA 2 [Dactylosporangium matsuzakiense]
MSELSQTRRNFAAPLRRFIATESGSAGVLVAAIVAALVWANLDEAGYERLWSTELALKVGSWELADDLRAWVNSGLMTLFFLVVGLEARRELDLGDLRDRRRFLLPSAAGVAGMVLPVGIYLAINAGGGGAHGWGVAMSTDTALALGLLTLVGKGVPEQARVFLLTVFVVDDLVALIVIAVAYSEHIAVMPLVLAAAVFGVLLGLRALGVRSGAIYAPFCILLWYLMLRSGVDPVVAGLAIGLTATAYTPARGALEAASGLFKLFREQPTAELARSASVGLTRTLSPNDRLQRMYHPWTSYLIVPLFGLANAGIAIDGAFLARAFTSPITLGVLAGYVVGKPIAVVGTSWAVTRLSRGRIRPGAGWAAVLGSGTIAGIGFTVSLLIASLAFTGDELAEAKLGVLAAAVIASLLTFVVYRVTARLPKHKRARALLGDADVLLDLIPPVDVEVDHVRGAADASVTIVEYGDFQCPYCGQAEPVVRALLSDTDLRYVWRHLPLTDVHPQAQLAAEAAEAAAAQGAFWPMHDLLLDHQDELKPAALVDYAERLGLDRDQFHDDLRHHRHAARIDQDLESADLSGVSGTPTFFINGQRHYGAYDLATLTEAVKVARARALIGRSTRTHSSDPPRL